MLVASPSFADTWSLRQSDESLRRKLLGEVPLGSKIGDVTAMLDQHGWKDHDFRDNGFLDQRVPGHNVVGTKSIRAELGHYRLLISRVYVTVFFGFDDQDRLIDVWVWKQTDGP